MSPVMTKVCVVGASLAGLATGASARGGQPVAVLGIDQPQQFRFIRRQLASIPASPSLQGATV